MTRELILLRHAHAGIPDIGQADFDRPLSPRGLLQAEAAGRWLNARCLIPDRVLYSPARRVRETLDAVLGVIGDTDKRLEQRIYEATVGALLLLIQEHADADRILLIGHNPGLEQLLAWVRGQQLHSGVQRVMPTASIAVLELFSSTDIAQGAAKLVACWQP